MTSHILGTEIGAWQTLAPLIPQLQGLLFHYDHFQDEETEPWKA